MIPLYLTSCSHKHRALRKINIATDNISIRLYFTDVCDCKLNTRFILLSETSRAVAPSWSVETSRYKRKNSIGLISSPTEELSYRRTQARKILHIYDLPFLTDVRKRVLRPFLSVCRPMGIRYHKTYTIPEEDQKEPGQLKRRGKPEVRLRRCNVKCCVSPLTVRSCMDLPRMIFHFREIVRTFRARIFR